MENKNILVIVYDKVSDNFSAPYLFANEASAKRWFCNLYLNKVKPICDNMSDYEIYIIGNYSTEDGTLIASEKKLLMKGNDVILGAKEDNING